MKSCVISMQHVMKRSKQFLFFLVFLGRMICACVSIVFHSVSNEILPAISIAHCYVCYICMRRRALPHEFLLNVFNVCRVYSKHCNFSLSHFIFFVFIILFSVFMHFLISVKCMFKLSFFAYYNK